jgi:hypothetical protein
MGRKRGSRFRKAIDAQEQYEQIEARQRKLRERRRGEALKSTAESKQRDANARNRLRNLADIPSEYDLEESA